MKCPCISWLKAYERLGNQEFYKEEHKHHTICTVCMLAVAGHGDWCKFCHGKGEIDDLHIQMCQHGM